MSNDKTGFSEIRVGFFLTGDKTKKSNFDILDIEGTFFQVRIVNTLKLLSKRVKDLSRRSSRGLFFIKNKRANLFEHFRVFSDHSMGRKYLGFVFSHLCEHFRLKSCQIKNGLFNRSHDLFPLKLRRTRMKIHLRLKDF